MSEAGEWYNWDHAYYKGKYYVYFGVVPAILFYLPYYVITGTHLHNHVLIFFLSLFFTAGCMGRCPRDDTKVVSTHQSGSVDSLKRASAFGERYYLHD